jgi:multiple sugar transport system substrate-binding protein
VSQSDTLFQRGEAAVTISGPWLIVRALLQPDVLAHTGIALPLGNPFVGGSNLVVWRHSRHPELAVELVRFLTSQQAQATCCQHAGLLPVRQDTLNTSFFAEQPYYQAMTQALQVGRSFPSFSMWGLVEDGLITGLAEIWSDVLTDPNVDLDVTIVKHLDPLARRLSLKLTQT